MDEITLSIEQTKKEILELIAALSEVKTRSSLTDIQARLFHQYQVLIAAMKQQDYQRRILEHQLEGKWRSEILQEFPKSKVA